MARHKPIADSELGTEMRPPVILHQLVHLLLAMVYDIRYAYTRVTYAVRELLLDSEVVCVKDIFTRLYRTEIVVVHLLDQTSYHCGLGSASVGSGTLT